MLPIIPNYTEVNTFPTNFARGSPGELTLLGFSLTAAMVQEVELADKGQLKVFEHAFRVDTSGGGRRVDYHRVGQPGVKPTSEVRSASGSWLQRLPGAGIVRRCRGWAASRLVRTGQPAATATSRPRWRAWEAVRRAYHKGQKTKVTWHLIPTAFSVGLRGGRVVGRVARRRWPLVTAGVAGVAAMVGLLVLTRDIRANMSGEEAKAELPPGFYIGQVNPDPPWGTKLLRYGVYVPPHFRGQAGPFPMVVYLHGYGERTPQAVFTRGVPRSITTQFGDGKRHGRFEMVALFPIDPAGKWSAGGSALGDTMQIIDYAAERHKIDPKRVYLTGMSNGANGVWRLAAAHPDRWAAVAPVSSFYQPDVAKVRHIPAWVHHGAKDKQAKVEPVRALVASLKDAGADVTYTEYPDQGHTPWKAYDARGLYDWFATKRLHD